MNSIATRLTLSPSRSSSPTQSLSPAKSEGDLRKVIQDGTVELGSALKHTLSNRETTSIPRSVAALTSPCFFHRRFKDSVDLQKVLEEMADDESMSHSVMMQTATSVREVSRQLQKRPIRRAVRTIMIVTKARDNSLVTLTRELAEWLIKTPRYKSRHGVTCYVDAKLRSSKRFDAASLLAQDPQYEQLLQFWTPDLCWTNPERFDLVLTLGGDGTVLFTSWLFQRIVPPILSFSLGSLGFLTTFDFRNYKEHLDKVMGGINGMNGIISGSSTPHIALPTPPSTDPRNDSGMRINLRMRFTCTVFRAPSKTRFPRSSDLSDTTNSSSNPRCTSQFEILNELVIDRGPSPYVSNLELFGDDSLLTVIQADGVIFSTPTGSTAYSLSAGGSLVHPDIPAILLTPICPHTLSFRPMLLNDTVALRVAVPRNSRATAYASFDGKGRIELRQGDYVTIAASKYPFPTVVGGRTEWIDSVSRTLRWNTRGAQQKGWGGGKRSTRGSMGRLPSPAIAAQMREDEEVEIDEEGMDDEDGEEDDYDIEIEEENSEARDSGYEGSSASCNNGSTAGNDGASSPVRQAVL